MDIATALASVLSGFVVGLLVGLTGVGGGALMTPLLILLFGVQATTAVGTDLLYASATKGAGAATHGMRKTVDWTITARLASGSIPATILTIAALYLIDVKGNTSPRFIVVALAIALLLSAGCVLARPLLGRSTEGHPGAGGRLTASLTVLAGLLLGILVTLTSVGAGALGMTLLVMLYPHTPINRLVGSDIAHAVPLTLIAGLGHWILGSVDWGLVVALLFGSVPGVVIGSTFSSRMPDRALRPVLAAILIIVGIRMLQG